VGVEHVDELRDVLVELGSADHVTLLVGAGASVSTGLPLWDDFVTTLLVNTGVAPDLATATAILTSQDVELTTQAALAGLTPTERAEAISAALYGTDDPAEAVLRFTTGPVHEAVAQLMVDRGPRRATALTLNVDDLLEEAVAALDAVGAGLGVEPRDSSPRESDDRYVVHHLHGVLSRDGTRRSGELVFTLPDFHRVVSDANTWQRTELTLARQKGPLLLVGTSLSDLNIRLWTQQLSQNVGLHPTYVLLSREGLHLSRDTFARVRAALMRQWEEVGVRALYVDAYGDVAQVLRELVASGRTNYEPPSARVRRVYDATLADFSAHQGADASQLYDDLGPLRAALGPDANVTLWLSDGSGQLVRWAAHDRVHRMPELLRQVEAVPESPWLAVEALCDGDRAAEEALREGAHPNETRRWESVVAQPVFGRLGCASRVPVAVLTSATTWQVTDADTVDRWSDVMAGLAEEWGERLVARVPT
jgi:hypothetical protein